MPGHQLINQLARQATPEELGGIRHVSDRLHISRAEQSPAATTRALWDRASSGRRLAQQYADTARHSARRIGTAHIAVMPLCFERCCPAGSSPPPRTATCSPGVAGGNPSFSAPEGPALLPRRPSFGWTSRPGRLAYCLNPDGNFTDDRARRRGLMLGKQDIDGMSRSRLADPRGARHLRGRAGQTGRPRHVQPRRSTVIDRRAGRPDVTPARRANATMTVTGALRAMLASGELGQHNAVADLHRRDHYAAHSRHRPQASPGVRHDRCSADADVIRWLATPTIYLAIFDKGTLGGLVSRQKTRLAGATNRAARQRPRLLDAGCDVPGYLCEVTPRRRLRHLPEHRHRQAHLRLRTPPSAAQTAAGTPANAPTATPNGFRRRI